MTISTLRRLINPSNVRATWAAFWREAHGQHATGIDGVTPAEFHRNEERNIARLILELKRGYKFSLLRAYPILKKDGVNFRILCVPTVQDRIVQRLLAQHLSMSAAKLGILNEASFGFIRSTDGQKRGVGAARIRAVELRRRHRWAYKSDISAFFDRIPREELLKQTIAALGNPVSILPLLRAAADCEIDDAESAIKRIAALNGIVKGVGLRQGMPLSPIFSNVILRHFDAEMLRRGHKPVRYADDFIVLADSERECREIDQLCRRLLRPLGLHLPELGNSKTQIAAPDQDIEFLGMALAPAANESYGLYITPKQLENVRKKVGQLKDVEQLLRKNIGFGKLGIEIEMKLAGYRAAYSDADNFDDLRVLLEETRADVMFSVFIEGFGRAKVDALPPHLKSFFFGNVHRRGNVDVSS
jgi:hypothetical protein